jgi:hypothetical protein
MSSIYTYCFLGEVGDADKIIATLGRKYLPVPVDEQVLYDNYLREMPHKKITVRTPIPFKRFKVQVEKFCSKTAVDSVRLAEDFEDPDPTIFCVVCRVECDSMINACGSGDLPLDYCNKCCGCKDCWVERHDCACFFGKEGGHQLCEFCDECAECGDHEENDCEWERKRKHCDTCGVLIFDESRKGDRGSEDNLRCFDGHESCMMCCMCLYCVEYKAESPCYFLHCSGKCVPKKFKVVGGGKMPWWGECGFTKKCACAYNALIKHPTLSKELIEDKR